MFDTHYTRNTKNNVSNPGCCIENTYTVDSDGNPVKSGTRDVYAEIQSHRASVELSTLLQRYMLGDETALNQVQGFFADTTDMPSNYAEYIQRAREAESYFSGLPDDFRSKFKDSEEFFSLFGTDEMSRRLNELFESRKVIDSKDNLPGSHTVDD